MIRGLLGRLDRLQRSRRYRVGATVAAGLLVAGAFAWLWVAANAPDAAERVAAAQAARAEAGAGWLDAGPVGAVRGGIDTLLVRLAEPGAALGVAAGAAALVGVIATFIWLGVSISFLGLLAAGWAVAWPLTTLEATRGLGQLLMGLVPIVIVFLTLLEAARLALSGASPLTAIARNVLNEAVRMKISVVFIVLLLLLVAAIPGLLTEDQPLRYRVQQWLQYGLGFSFAVLSLLTIFLSVGTVSYEQREKVIWQTMTKPVRAWHYAAGKWLGIMTLNAVLLAVSASGVFLFTEYLRTQKAEGESAYYVDLLGRSTRAGSPPPSVDRRLLEDHVLVARVSSRSEPFALTPARLDRIVRERLERMDDPTPEDARELREAVVREFDEGVERAVQARFEELRARNPEVAESGANLQRLEDELREEMETLYRSIEPGATEAFYFDVGDAYRAWIDRRDRVLRAVDAEVDRRIDRGDVTETTPEARDALRGVVLTEMRESGLVDEPPSLTLQYKIQAGTNDPADLYRAQFYVNGVPHPFDGTISPTEFTLNALQTLDFPVGLVREDGVVQLGVVSAPDNERTITFPPDGLEILYAVGGYEANFLRVCLVLWVKLGFIASVGIAAATFLNFPVACLVTIGIWVMAVTSGFLGESLEYYSVQTREGTDYLAFVVRLIAVPVAWMFGAYTEVRPTEDLVSGRLIRWSSVATVLLVLGAWAAGVLLAGIGVLRRRELAIYSGH